ncbi:hypothetical protein LZ32DRAFT_662877 [Colletotrichum eremochloae]|nr:hypothetical protein LZ32DRAFT_662877 [Colletotrichum eremochloae]
MSQITNQNMDNLATPTTLVGSNSSESIIFVDPAMWSKQPKSVFRSATDARAPKPLMRDQGTAPDRVLDQDHPSTSNSSTDMYRDELRLGCQSETVFETSVSPRHVDISTQPMTSQLDADIMDFDFGGNENYEMDNGAFDTASVADSSDDGCLCLSDLVQSFEARTDSCQTKADSLEVVRILNETSERLIHCKETHSGIWYSMLLALYEEAEGSLSSLQSGEQTSGGVSHLHTSHPRREGPSDKPIRAREQPRSGSGTSSVLTSTIFKAFTALSTVVAALPFKSQANIDKAHQDVVVMYAERLRNKFRSRLVEITALNV